MTMIDVTHAGGFYVTVVNCFSLSHKQYFVVVNGLISYFIPYCGIEGLKN